MSTAGLKAVETYSVPKRFGLRTVIFVTTLFAMMFAVVKWSQQPILVPTFYAVFVALIAVSQMICEKAPRIASIGTGAIYLPVCFMVEPGIRDHFAFSYIGERLVMLILAGSFLAYLGGTILAGVFLVIDLGQAVMPGRGRRFERPGTANRLS